MQPWLWNARPGVPVVAANFHCHHVQNADCVKPSSWHSNFKPLLRRVKLHALPSWEHSSFPRGRESHRRRFTRSRIQLKKGRIHLHVSVDIAQVHWSPEVELWDVNPDSVCPYVGYNGLGLFRELFEIQGKEESLTLKGGQLVEACAKLVGGMSLNMMFNR